MGPLLRLQFSELRLAIVALALAACAEHGAEPQASRAALDRPDATVSLTAAGSDPLLTQGEDGNSRPTCPSPQSIDVHADDRASCYFGEGATVEDSLSFMPTERARIPLTHVIVLMKENRSYDHIFGMLAKQGQPDSEAIPSTFTNNDDKGIPVYPYHAGTTCLKINPGHQWSAMHRQVDGGRMDGFIRASHRTDVMSYYDQSDLPFYYFLANTYALADRAFASVRSGTWPNRDYLMLATSGGVHSTGSGRPSPSLPTIFSQLDARGVNWGAFAGAEPFEGSLGWKTDHQGVATIDVFRQQLADGTLPAVSFVDAPGGNDEHPPVDIQEGESWSYSIYQAVRQSPLWPSLALFFTYDEGGGFFDHVSPPEACIARGEDLDFHDLGVRVPLIVISRFARPHYVSHVQHQHTSILRFIQLLFDLPALTRRDANSDALLDMFDFACPVDAIPEAPPAGQGGCK